VARQTPRKTPKNTTSINRFETLLSSIDWLGRTACGDLWKTVCESFQDAISLSLIVKVPNLITYWLTGKEFKGLDSCSTGTTWFSTDRYICLIIVCWDLAGWAVLAARMIKRFIQAMQGSLASGKNSGA
jgi:hypothetical protein